MPATRRSSKRTYTFSRFRHDTALLLNNRSAIQAAMRGGRISKAFAEKIMLAVTQVNGCRWCNYAHTRIALRAGVSEAELHSLLKLELGDFPPDEAVALAFAQHYAESSDHPDAAAWRRVVESYGPDTAQDVLALIQMITAGNLLGNTFDAFLFRLKGQPTPHSRVLDEVAVLGASLLCTLPLCLIMGADLLGRRLSRRIAL